MRIAVAVDGDAVSGPGEAAEIRIYDVGSDFTLIESYKNPALTAQMARGIAMLKSAVEKGAKAIIVSGVGAHAFTYTTGRVKLYLGNEMTAEQALMNFSTGKLLELTSATHEHGHHDHH